MRATIDDLVSSGFLLMRTHKEAREVIRQAHGRMLEYLSFLPANGERGLADPLACRFPAEGRSWTSAGQGCRRVQ